MVEKKDLLELEGSFGIRRIFWHYHEMRSELFTDLACLCRASVDIAHNNGIPFFRCQPPDLLKHLVWVLLFPLRLIGS